MSDEKKFKRIHRVPNRKWKLNEERALVNFLKENPDFEKPTVQAYYKRFNNQIEHDINWNFVRAKVENLIINYNQAKTNATVNAREGESVRDAAIQIFPYYDEFNEIFDSKDNENQFPNDYANETIGNEDILESDAYAELCGSDAVDDQNDRNPKRAMGNTSPVHLEPKRQKLHESAQLPLRQQQLLYQREKIQFEREKLRLELKIRQQELESQEKVKKLELEMKERIAMCEIKMKERVALQALEKKWQ